MTHETDDEIGAELLREIRELEARGVLWTTIAADGRMKCYVAEPRPEHTDRDRDNVTSLGNAARKRRRKVRS
jgi:hypothetical protein